MIFLTAVILIVHLYTINWLIDKRIESVIKEVTISMHQGFEDIAKELSEDRVAHRETMAIIMKRIHTIEEQTEETDKGPK